jgi:neuropeptide Y receptor type 1
MSIDTTMTTTTVNNNINCVGCSNNSIPLASSIFDGIQLDVLIISSFFYICIFITGVVGNLLVVYVLLKEKELKNFTNYLLANLSIADLMVLFTCVPPGK